MMDLYTRAVLIIFMSECVAVNINRLGVPQLVPMGVDSLILDCDYSLGEVSRNNGLVLKWFFNQRNLVYQWIPPLNPQVIGILKNKVDKEFTISGTGKNFQFIQEKKYVFLVTLICAAEKMYPKPEMIITSHGEPLKKTATSVTMDSWGLYTVMSTAVVHDDDVTRPYEEFTCTVQLPFANFEANRTTVYYPGLMPTPQVAAGTEKALNRHSSASNSIVSRLELSKSSLILIFILCYS